MDLGNISPKKNMNIFNKNVFDPYNIYNKILKNEKISFDDIIELNKYTAVIKIKYKKDIKTIINYYLKYHYYQNISLNWLNVSYIKSMNRMFKGVKLYWDISKWDVSNVTDMSNMFENTYFDNKIDISNWDVSNVTDMSNMFNSSNFSGDISKWDTSNVTNMSFMFKSSLYFNGDISKWNTSNVTNMHQMFMFSHFNNDISRWDVSNVKDMSKMFEYSKFNQDISGWDVSNVKDMKYMFASSSFDNDISNWNVSNVEVFDSFYGATKNNIFKDCHIKD